jgi:hypothetical protein
MMTQIARGNAKLEEVEAALGEGANRPVSMKELQVASQKLGFRLKGVALEPERHRLDAAALCYLRGNTPGHFIVIHPRSDSEDLIQVLDPNLAPYVMERSELVKLPGWTGLALVPERLVGWWRVAGVALLVGGVGLMVVAWLRSKGYLACIVRRSPDTARAGEVGP